MIIILIVSAVIFWRILPEKDERSSIREFEKRRLMDYLSAITVIIFLVCAVFLIFDPTRLGASNVNLLSAQIVTVWTTILAVIMLVYRLYSKRSIPD